jgi:hypothetical protein
VEREQGRPDARIAGVATTVAIAIRLARVRDRGAVVDEVDHPIGIAILLGKRRVEAHVSAQRVGGAAVLREAGGEALHAPIGRVHGFEDVEASGHRAAAAPRSAHAQAGRRARRVLPGALVAAGDEERAVRGLKLDEPSLAATHEDRDDVAVRDVRWREGRVAGRDGAVDPGPH